MWLYLGSSSKGWAQVKENLQEVLTGKDEKSTARFLEEIDGTVRRVTSEGSGKTYKEVVQIVGGVEVEVKGRTSLDTTLNWSRVVVCERPTLH